MLTQDKVVIVTGNASGIGGASVARRGASCDCRDYTEASINLLRTFFEPEYVESICPIDDMGATCAGASTYQ